MVILVIFLLILKLTVAVGTISGLIFYANILVFNRAQLFPSGETNILTVFIAWVNLDLGIETCFFDGMDAYYKAWLQYAFPIYVWVLVGAIILASSHSSKIARSLGTNPVAVLATLFLLSYAKLLCSIINPLFVITLEYPSDSKKVWLVDGNVPHLKGKHVPLFLISLLALFLLFIPFTLLLLLGQWIQSQSERKCCSWISDYRISIIIHRCVPWAVQEQASLLVWTSTCDQVFPLSGLCFQCLLQWRPQSEHPCHHSKHD